MTPKKMKIQKNVCLSALMTVAGSYDTSLLFLSHTYTNKNTLIYNYSMMFQYYMFEYICF